MAGSQGSGIEFRIPIEVVLPALMQVVRRKHPAISMKLGHRGPGRLLGGKHVGLVRQKAALLQIARRASRNDIFPRGLSTLGARGHMIEG